MTDCPSPEMLTRLGSDAIGDPSFAAIEGHVENCPECAKVLDRLARDDDPEPVGAHRPELPGFVIEEELGRGSMGVVYRARWTEIHRPVAIKVLPGGVSGDPEHRRWLREARLLSKVPSHPHVVQLLSLGRHERWLYLVLELVTGGSLKDRLASPMSPRAAAEFLEATARGVDHIHRAGVLHLDVKPSNILIEGPEDGAVPRVADFGIARLGDDPGATQTVPAGPRGTPRYMAPEQISKEIGPLGPPADVHALGATLYHMLTGRPPFLSASVEETYRQVRFEDPIPPRRLIAGIPRDLETICAKCLHKDPARRYPTALELADDLRRWLDGYPIRARPVSTSEHALCWCRRRPAVAGLVAALGLSLIAGFLGLLILWRRAKDEGRRAEAAGRTARANFEATSRSLEELLILISKTYRSDEPPGHFIAVMERARGQQLDQRGQYPGDVAGLKRLARIDRLLGFAYFSARRFREARSVFDESLDLWDAIISSEPDDIGLRAEQMHSALKLGEVIEAVPELLGDEVLISGWNRRSEAIGRQLLATTESDLTWFKLSRTQRHLAHELSRIGASGQSKRLFRSNLNLLDSLPPSLGATTEVALFRVLSRAALGEWDGDLMPFRSAAGAAPGSPVPRNFAETCLAELTARKFGWLGRPANPSELTTNGASPESWAACVIDTLRTQSAEIGYEPSSVPRVAWKMQGFVASVASKQRRGGELDAARRTVDHLRAMAKQLARLYPDSPETRLLLSEAHFQESKNAYQVDDKAAIARALRQAVDEARRASALAPDEEEIRRLLADRRRRLDRSPKP